MADVIVRKRYRKNGETMYEYRFEIATIDGKRQWKTKCGFKTMTEARKAGRIAFQSYENAGCVIEKDRMSVSDYLDFWMENDCMIDLMPTTINRYKTKIETLIKPKLGAYRLKSLTRDILQAFITDTYDLGYSYNSLTTLKGILTKSMNYAEDHHYINYSPAVRLKIPKNRRPKVPTRTAPHYFIPPDIMKKVFERFPERHPSHIPLKLGYECGMRLGEVFGLCWEDIDFKKKVIHVNRQVQWLQDKERKTVDKVAKNGTKECGNGYWYFCPPKYKSYRTIEISDELADLLFVEQARQCRGKEYYGIYYTNYDVEQPFTFNGVEPQYPVSINKMDTNGDGYPIHLVCTRENGTFISPRTMQNVIRCVKKEITEDFDFHSLRKTHASMLNELGIDQKYIQTRLGHSDMDMTINVYECTTELMRENGRKALNKMFK
jgi:integrase